MVESSLTKVSPGKKKTTEGKEKVKELQESNNNKQPQALNCAGKQVNTKGSVTENTL